MIRGALGSIYIKKSPKEISLSDFELLTPDLYMNGRIPPPLNIYYVLLLKEAAETKKVPERHTFRHYVTG